MNPQIHTKTNTPDESLARTEFQKSRRPPCGNVQLESTSRSPYPGRPGPEGFPNGHKRNSKYTLSQPLQAHID